MASKAAGMGVMLAGLMVIGLAFIGLPIGGGGGGGTPERVCDLVGTIVGKTHDDNVFKYVEVSSINLAPTDCHDRQWYEFSLNQAALFTPGQGKIRVAAVDDSGGVARAVEFTITTVAGEVEKSFSQNVRLEGLVQGDTYTIQVSAPDWENGQIKGTKQIIV